MNEFEKRMNALRLQYRNERVQITRDCNRTIGRLNTAIGKVNSVEARDALRAEKQRVFEAMRNSHKYNRLCYLQQLEAIENEYGLHLEENPSKRQVRRMMAAVCKFVESAGAQSYTVALDDTRQATITFG